MPARRASRSASGPARRKKNQAAPTISQTRPSSDVSWRMFGQREAEHGDRGRASPAPARPSVRQDAEPRRHARAISPAIDSVQASARASGWRRNSSTDKISMPSHRWPW